MPRLRVDRIVSVGAVAAGDNPEAEILFFKSKKRRDHPAAVFVKALARQGDALQVAAETAAEARQIIKELDERKTMPETTTADVRAEVDAKAEKLMAKDADLSMAEARAQTWRDNPRLVRKSREATEAGGTVEKAGDLPLAEQVANAVHDRAAWWNAVPGLWTVTPAEARVHIWKSPEGVKLQALMRDHRKLSTIQKAKDHAEARAILKAWQTDPKAGLPASVPPASR